MRSDFIAALLFTTSFGPLIAQNTVGLITNEASVSQDGFTLFYPSEQHTAYLIDNCGRSVHRWDDAAHVPSQSFYLMENGDLVRCGKANGIGNPAFLRGGAGEFVDRRDWNGDLIWRYTYDSPTHLMHHDVAMMPNGNVLIVAWELKTLEEAAALGLDTVGFEPGAVWPDHVIEVVPSGIDEGTIVWEWHAWDHLVQDRDPELPGYGVIAEHPERIDINHHPMSDEDWIHVNSIDYNAELDQILLTTPFFNEIWIIDHSTTTAEAATSAGGNSGRGGDLLYRWGSPDAYGRGDESDRTLFFPHHARWMGPGLLPDDPDRGNIIVFNNQAGVGFSSVDLLTPPWDGTSYTIEGGSAFGPSEAYRRITSDGTLLLNSGRISSAQKLRNGNTLICSGRQGYFVEVDPSDEVVWEYIVPVIGDVPIAQGTTIAGPDVFMALKYPTDHPFLGLQDFPTDMYVELDPDTTFCGSLTVGLNQGPDWTSTSIHPNPTASFVTIPCKPGSSIRISDLFGRVVRTERATSDLHRVDLRGSEAGTYVVQVDDGKAQRIVIEK